MEKKLFLKFYRIDSEEFVVMIEEAQNYAISKGVIMRQLTMPHYAVGHLPFCFVPSTFPKHWFDLVSELQLHINYILLQISYSKEMLKEFLTETIEADSFIQKLYDIFLQVCERELKQTSLGLLRSDYMLNCDDSGSVDNIKQVETNTIASGFCGIGPNVQLLYEFILKKLEWKSFHSKIIQNESCSKMAEGLISAWKLYNCPRAVILFVVEEATYNVYDQKALEFKLLQLSENIEVLRSTFKQLRHSLAVVDNKLFVKKKEVAVVYYRIGYSPEHYEEVDWNTRLLIELSDAIKSPTVGLHLAGTKKVQFYLTKKSVLERFVSSEVSEKLQQVFVNLYLLSKNEKSDFLISKALNNPGRFVLKAEREGGGNNLYGDDLRNFLETSSPKERDSYLLMDRINPPEVINCIVRSNRKPDFCFVTNELGIFGVIIGNKDTVYENYYAGHVLRSKPKHLDEVGVSAGFGALDYPYFE